MSKYVTIETSQNVNLSKSYDDVTIEIAMKEDEILRQLYDNNNLKIRDIVSVVSVDDLMDEIGKEAFMKYFGVEEKE